jgi:hypothetical protein
MNDYFGRICDVEIWTSTYAFVVDWLKFGFLQVKLYLGFRQGEIHSWASSSGVIVNPSVVDPDPDPDPPDPHVFGPPGSGSGSTGQRCGFWA